MYIFFPLISSTDGDYDGTSQVVVIPASPGPSETCFDIGIVDDSIVENNEDFQVSFAIPPGTNAEVGPISSIRVIIVDDDRKEFKHYIYDANYFIYLIFILLRNPSHSSCTDWVQSHSLFSG